MEERSQTLEAKLEQPLLAAAVLTIPVTIIQLLPAGDPWRTIADVLNWAIWLVFTGEVILMLSVVPDRRHWLRHHPLEIAIVVLTAPLLTSAIQSIRVLRLLRLFRLLRLAPLLRIVFSAEGVRLAGLLTLLTTLGGGLTFASVESRSPGDGIYWAVTTVTTVGYGDITPKTAEGKAIAVAVMLVGIGFAALVIGAIADRFTRRDAAEVDTLGDNVLAQVKDISVRLQRLERTLEQTRQDVG